MDLARSEYPALLQSLDPEQAVDVLSGRVAVVNKIHADIADWLQERRKIEEQYATSLRKLSRRPQQDNAAALGVFQMPWQRIVNSTENMAQTHEQLAAKIQADVEGPLRQYQSINRELQSMGNVSGNLAAIAKDLANARRKADKLDAKGSNKIEDARSNVEDASSQCESQAPFVFEQLQAMDEARINHLRDVLTQLQTHELDAVERGRASAESCLNALLNVETADEIRTFAARARAQSGSSAPRRDSLIGSSRPAGSVPPVPPPPRQASVEHRNSSIPGQDRLAPLPEPPKKEKLSTLKRFGTVMGRRKNAAPPPVPAEKKKEKTRSFAPFRRQESTRSFQDLESTGQDLSPAVSRDGRASSRHESERPPQTQESRVSESQPAPAVNGFPSQTTQPIVPDTTVPQISIPDEQPEPPTLNQGIASQAMAGDRRSTLPDPISRQSDPPSLSGEEAARNFEIKDQPIPEDASAAQLAMDNIQNQLRLQAQNSGLNRPVGSVRGRRDVRNTMFVSNPPEILSSSSTNLGSSETPISAATTTTPTVTSSTPGTTDNGTIPELISPVKRSLGTGTIPEDASQIASDTHSVHSSHSLAGLGYHHEMSHPGLNASLVETVNTWLSDEGVSRSFVVGEIALAYNKTLSTNSADHETVRLQNFHQLEKCAQNPQFVTPLSDNQQPGTYSVALGSISRSIPTVAFKYQLHLDQSSLSAASPLLVTQAWQIVAGQASVIVFYSLNPAFAPVANTGSSPSPPPAELTLKNVALTVNLDVKPSTSGEAVAKAVNAQMMPVQGAQFKKRSGAVVWKFPELVLKPTQERLLVRFTVENNGMAKRGGVEVKFEAPGILGSALGVEKLVNVGEAVTPSVQASDPFADEVEARKSAEGGQRWDDVQSRKVLVSGKYSAT